MTEQPDDEPNEILAAAAAAKAHERGAGHAAEDKRRESAWQSGKAWLGVGIGSAAVAAAVLFANSKRKD